MTTPNPSAPDTGSKCVYPSEEMRKAFEAEFAQSPYEWSFTRHSLDERKSAWPGQYRVYHVQCAWEAWQAACSHQREQDALICEKNAINCEDTVPTEEAYDLGCYECASAIRQEPGR